MATMTHAEAVSSGATERYLLSQMPEPECDAFEEHYFDCFVCADDVKAGFVIAQELRRKPAGEVVRFWPRVRGKVAVYATAASIALVGLAGWEQVRIQGLQTTISQQRQIGVPQTADFSSARGESIPTFDSHRAAALLVIIDPADVAPLYTWSIIDAQNRVKLTRQVSDSQAQTLMFPITIPAGSLEPGKYALRVLSKQEARYEFTVR